jgi:hypothetical protein
MDEVYSSRASDLLLLLRPDALCPRVLLYAGRAPELLRVRGGHVAELGPWNNLSLISTTSPYLIPLEGTIHRVDTKFAS